MAPKDLAERQDRERRMWETLEEAIRAAEVGDVLAEERAIQTGARIAESFKVTSFTEGWRAGGRGGLSDQAFEFNNRLIALATEGRLRRTEYLGFVGQYHFWRDRILAPDKSVYLMDENVQATVETAGSISVSRRPTLTRMAAGAILPGSALIPGFALAKKETLDSRELYFVLEHPAGAAVIQLQPQYGQAVREVAAAINAAAAQLGRERQALQDDAQRATTQVADTVALLKDLANLRDNGALTPEEFEEQKARVLGHAAPEPEEVQHGD
jgi:hypothetical protein